MRIAFAQITSTEDLNHNLQQIKTCIGQTNADLICFPENSLFLRLKKSSPTRYFTIDEIANLNIKAECPVMLTTAMLVDGQRSNTTLLLRPNEKPQILYQKIHLFDVDVPGAPPVKESDHFDFGKAPKILDFNGWKIGLTICYDLRFSELFLTYAKAGVDAVLVPSAFLVPTGEAHWHVLLRARAIEGQFYVIAPAQSGEHRMGEDVRHTYGHSLAVDPWGRVLAELESSPTVVAVELKRAEIEKVRRQIPMASHRRLFT